MDFENKVALVTGASRGIGRAIALQLAQSGAIIAFNYRSSEGQASKLIEQIEASGGTAVSYCVDIGDFEAVKAMAGEIKSTLGKIDIVVNNAGIARDTPLVSMTEQQWDDVIDINLKGVFNCTRAVAYSMMKQKNGRFLNITSIAGISGQKGQTNYAASKAGIIGFTKSFAREVAPLGMNVNALALGFIDTDMTGGLSDLQKEKALNVIPIGRFGSTTEVSRIAAFLLSDAAQYITGQVLVVDGGLTM